MALWFMTASINALFCSFNEEYLTAYVTHCVIFVCELERYRWKKAL